MFHSIGPCIMSARRYAERRPLKSPTRAPLADILYVPLLVFSMIHCRVSESEPLQPNAPRSTHGPAARSQALVEHADALGQEREIFDVVPADGAVAAQAGDDVVAAFEGHGCLAER